jgi:hypothetical protein
MQQGGDITEQRECPECLENSKKLNETGVFGLCGVCSDRNVVEIPGWLYTGMGIEIEALPYRVGSSCWSLCVDVTGLLQDQVGMNQLHRSLCKLYSELKSQMSLLGTKESKLRKALQVLHTHGFATPHTMEAQGQFYTCDVCRMQLPGGVWTSHDVLRCDACFKRHSINIRRDSPKLNEFVFMKGWRNVSNDTGLLCVKLAVDYIPPNALIHIKTSTQTQLESVREQKKVLRQKASDLLRAVEALRAAGVKYRTL